MTGVRTMTVGLVYLGCAAIAVMVGTTVVDVVGRLVFGVSLIGAYDIVQFALVVSVYAGMPEAFRQGAHIAVDLIDRAVGERFGRVLATAGLAASLLVFLLLTWLCVGEALDIWRFGDTTADLAIPKVWHWIGIVVGLVATCLTQIALLVGEIAGRETVRDTSGSSFHA